MKKLALFVSIAAMGFALGAKAHDGPSGATTHEALECGSTVSGGYYNNALNIAHGWNSELGKITVQADITWSAPSATGCNGETGQSLVEGNSVVRDRRGDLLFVNYTSGFNCAVPGDDDSPATGDLLGDITGGTGKHFGATGTVHSVGLIWPLSSNSSFGGTKTITESSCQNKKRKHRHDDDDDD